MKNIKWLLIVVVAPLLWSCSEDDLDPNTIFKEEVGVVENAFDVWLRKNYKEKYNIDFKYRFEDKESDTKYNLIAAEYTRSVAVAKMIKHVWFDAYEEAAGLDFVRLYCPKIVFLVGSFAMNTNGSVVLGTAEGGLKVTLYNVNGIDFNDLELGMLNYYYFKTMHHEFAHILHQTKNYSTDFNLISAKDYQSSSWKNLKTMIEALKLGFISQYASSEPREDFVETLSVYVTNDQQYWDMLLKYANDEAKSRINQKLEFVKDYMLTSWGIDIEDLREIILRRTKEILTMDLTTLD